MAGTTRVFGAVNGAGVQVREVQPAAPIQAGPFGSTVLVGIFRSGPVGVLQELSGLPMYRRVCGGLTQDSEAPLAAEHFYGAGAGAGKLYVVRLTDGTEVKGSLSLYSRDVEKSVLERAEAAKLPAVVAVLDAHNGGRWAGRRSVTAGDVTLSTAITGDSTIELGITTLTDKWKGALLRLPNDDAGAEYVVASNTAAGVVTITGTFSADALAGTDGRWTLELVNEHELTGKPENLAVEVADSAEAPGSKFSLYAHRDGASVKGWENLGLDAAGDAYWLTAITDDLDNFELAPTDEFTGDATDPYQLPANFAEIPAPAGVDGNVLTLQVVRWSRSGTGNPYLDTVNDVTWGSDPREVTITLTFTGATTFTVAAAFADGETVTGLPTGSTGAAYSSQHAWLPGFTIRAGATAADATTRMTLYFRPLPANLAAKGAWLYVAAAPGEGDTRVRYRVASNDHESVTLAPSVDLAGTVVAPGAPTITGSTAGPFDLSPSNLTFIYSLGGTGPYTLTESLSGASTSTTAAVAELNARELARAGSSAARLVEFSVGTGDKVKVTALQDFGSGAVISIGSGTLNPVLGFADDTDSDPGAEPTIVRLQWKQELGGGYDGISAIDADVEYVEAWDLSTSPLNDLLETNTGLIRVAMPGITDADAQGAMMTWAYTYNGLAYTEIPDTVTTVAAAVAWHEANLAIGPAQDYHVCHWPSYVRINSPYGTGLYTAPATGLILGVEAKIAVAEGGYHQAAANTRAALSPWAKDLPTGDTILDNEALNGYGLIEVRKRGPLIMLWGDRIPGDGQRIWKHKRATLSHVGRTLLTNTTQFVFSRINAATMADLRAGLRQLFEPWWRKGWFDDTQGPAFGDAVEIKVDDTNNPLTEREEGNLHGAVSFNVVNTAERVVFTIGPSGVTETA